ncbi:unnamed protein product [Rhizophagus irregularis]|nr:unnamed protein product [Rhizophagus irregularis]
MSQSTHVLFSNIFSETHPELHTLQQDLEQLQTAYLSDDHESNDIDSDNNTDTIPQHLVYVLIEEYEPNEQLHEDDKVDEAVFSPEQIQKFHQIYEKITMIEDDNEHNDKNQDIKNNLDKFDKIAQRQKLNITECCKEKCLKNKTINIEEAITRYQHFNKLTYGTKICNSAFLTIYGIGTKQWENARKHYIQYNINPRKHKLEGRSSNHAISFDDILNILTFIMNYANTHGLPSPGRHFKKETLPIVFLPVGESYSSLYRIYKDILENEDKKPIHLTTFWRIWQKYISEVKFLSPRSDLCFLCKSMRFNIKFWLPHELEEKVPEWQTHISWAQKERDYYKKCIEQSKHILQGHSFSRSGKPNSIDIVNHISWDFAEQVKLPYSSQQEGTTYFKSLYSVQVFRVCEDAFPRQVNYLIKEEESVGKGADVTEFLTNYFKNVPSILKQHHFFFSKDKIGSVEISETVDGERHLIDIRKSNMKKPSGFPCEISSKGLSIERQWYLYEQIRVHVQDPSKQDHLYPKPIEPKPKK